MWIKEYQPIETVTYIDPKFDYSNRPKFLKGDMRELFLNLLQGTLNLKRLIICRNSKSKITGKIKFNRNKTPLFYVWGSPCHIKGAEMYSYGRSEMARLSLPKPLLYMHREYKRFHSAIKTYDEALQKFNMECTNIVRSESKSFNELSDGKIIFNTVDEGNTSEQQRLPSMDVRILELGIDVEFS